MGVVEVRIELDVADVKPLIDRIDVQAEGEVVFAIDIGRVEGERDSRRGGVANAADQQLGVDTLISTDQHEVKTGRRIEHDAFGEAGGQIEGRRVVDDDVGRVAVAVDIGDPGVGWIAFSRIPKLTGHWHRKPPSFSMPLR